jgi:hypothetical protein
MKPCRKHDGLARAIDWLVDDRMFSSLERHGNTNWKFMPLITMALCWAWGSEAGLQERFCSGLNILARLFRRGEWGQTYQGFLKILRTWSDRLQTILKARLRERMQRLAEEVERIQGWTVMAVDGTRVAAPRTDANLSYFSRPVRGRQRSRRKASGRRRKPQPSAPQVWLTVIWHVGLGLLWDWRQGPTGSSERAHLQEMISELPAGSLLVADAGFQGYEYWKSLLDQGHSFVIRVAGQVRLLRGLGWARRYKNMVYLWPDRACQRREPPLALRLWEFHDSRQSWWLVTNVLETSRLPARAVQEIYRRRWGVEVFLRGFKQTFGRDQLRSHAPHNVQLELDWSLLGLWSLELLAVHELVTCGQSPYALSTAGALRAIRQTLQATALGCDLDLFSRLAALRHDGYRRRQKAIRIWPRKRGADTIKGPVIRYATFEQFQAAQELRPNVA